MDALGTLHEGRRCCASHAKVPPGAYAFFDSPLFLARAAHGAKSKSGPDAQKDGGSLVDVVRRRASAGLYRTLVQ
jgi:hypothetical protein